MKNLKPKTWLNKWSFNKVEGYLMVLITIMLVVDVFLGILARFIHFQSVFATELGKYLFIWLCLIGISAAAKDNQHIRISYIVEKLPVNPKITWILSQVIFLAFSILLFYVSIRLTWMHITMKKSTIGFNFPMFVFTAALPIGFFLTSLRLIQDIYKSAQGSMTNMWGIEEKTMNELKEQQSKTDS